MIGVAHTLASLPFATLQLGAFSGWWLVPTYAMLIFSAYVLRRRDIAKEKTAHL